jgi:hypothetical protein
MGRSAAEESWWRRQAAHVDAIEKDVPRTNRSHLLLLARAVYTHRLRPAEATSRPRPEPRRRSAGRTRRDPPACCAPR